MTRGFPRARNDAKRNHAVATDVLYYLCPNIRAERTRMTKPKAVCLLSGGLDSVTVLAIARSRGFELYALSFRYGQRHVHELDCAGRAAVKAGVLKHSGVDIDLAAFGGSALTDSAIAVPKNRAASEMGEGIPVTYVPARNTIFLSFALAWGETLG